MRLLVTDGRDERLRETGMYFVRRIDDAGRVLGEWGRRGAGLRLTWFAQCTCACACACARGIPDCARSCVRVHWCGNAFFGARLPLFVSFVRCGVGVRALPRTCLIRLPDLDMSRSDDGLIEAGTIVPDALGALCVPLQAFTVCCRGS